MSQYVTVTMDNGIADVRLNRPEKMNALNTGMFAELLEVGERLRRDTSLRVVVLSGNGKAFCAGLDMQSFERILASGSIDDAAGGPFGSGLIERTFGAANAYQRVATVWRDIPAPVIAAVHGVAFGGGFQIALGADMRFVAPDTRMAVREVQWGIVPDMAGMLFMSELARPDVVRDLTYSGREFSGEEALRLGFATQLHADPRAAALDYACGLAEKSVDALRACKRLLNLALTADPAAILQAESLEQERLIGSAGQLAAIEAHLRKGHGG
ncbi:crotonase/enoyl-CoA hydratase family protein [Rugamonas apoptosis]|uniref:Crotonase/enoyl-CoA hydratase family protein n=1 Tax=Rugamonas apoptosis TaxID=2758570 RepID=A0A7W2ILX0_9BURK|nr:crotonase/enoyl-CoA hydratase family protein [Rugamonas apoptosis]MBA5688907.1 crotonase/enoyl-CoA hydratase family protein [Rugamonas apoptosis]